MLNSKKPREFLPKKEPTESLPKNKLLKKLLKLVKPKISKKQELQPLLGKKRLESHLKFRLQNLQELLPSVKL